jgi:hypothetical protein
LLSIAEMFVYNSLPRYVALNHMLAYDNPCALLSPPPASSSHYCLKKKKEKSSFNPTPEYGNTPVYAVIH